jgi:hypothetical protein
MMLSSSTIEAVSELDIDFILLLLGLQNAALLSANQIFGRACFSVIAHRSTAQNFFFWLS